MKNRCILYFFISCFFALTVGIYISIKICPCALGNSIYLLLENNFFIPKESDVCVFRKTMSAGGSGDGWLYGEDDKYYYGLNIDNELEPCTVYYILKKEEVSRKFDKHNYRTWNKRKRIGWLPEKFRTDEYTEDCNK